MTSTGLNVPASQGTTSHLPTFSDVHSKVVSLKRPAENQAVKQQADDRPAPRLEEAMGLLRIYNGADWLRCARYMPEPQELWLKTWYEGEVCCLFADSNLGKSIYAVQIGMNVAKTGKRVLYCDFELSEKQFQLRYTDEQGNMQDMPDTFLRADLNPDYEIDTDANFCTTILQAIEEAAVTFDADVLIIDNITYLSMMTESGDAASMLMVKLMRLKKIYDWSMLILAHTPKRMLDQPLTANDLAGSKKLFNFFDSVMAIGKNLGDESMRYVKQLKVRHGAFIYDATNVMLYEIEKDGAMLQFTARGTGAETDMLQPRQKGLTPNDVKNIRELREQGVSIRGIAERLNISKARVKKCLKMLKEKNLLNPVIRQ